MSETLSVYIYIDQQRHFPKFTIRNNARQIASVIARTSMCTKIVVTDSCDEFILNTMDGFIDRCDKTILEEVLLHLIPMQEKEQEPDDVSVLGCWREFDTEQERIKFLENELSLRIGNVAFKGQCEVTYVTEEDCI